MQALLTSSPEWAKARQAVSNYSAYEDGFDPAPEWCEQVVAAVANALFPDGVLIIDAIGTLTDESISDRGILTEPDSKAPSIVNIRLGDWLAVLHCRPQP